MSTDESGRITALLDFIKEKGGEAVLIPAQDIVTAEWVRQKCLFGCNGFGRRFSCPPYTPTPAETREVLKDYKTALLIRFRGDIGEPSPERLVSREMTRHVQQVMFELEQLAFSLGFYKTLGYTGHQCGWCAHCPAKDDGAKITDCRNRRKMRPSMEAAGIDVYAACASVGWDLDILTCTKVEDGYVLDSPMTTVMLLLLE
jgi:predicted metal-binding protein